MIDFEAKYHQELQRRGLTASGLSQHAATLVWMTSDWFRRYGQQQAGDREANRLTNKALEERISRLERELSALKNKGDAA